MKLLALITGLCVACFGLLGIAIPEILFGAARLVQHPPMLYLVAALRVGVGVVFFLAAPASRLPTVLRVLGAVVFIGGLLTPFFGTWGAQLVLDWWTATGPLLVRAFGAIALAFGAFVVYAFSPPGKAK